jgi:hypothetical protein
MNLIASFKCCMYEWEDEWRIVCGPRCAAAASAPDMDDEAFKPLIKTGEKARYVELRLPQHKDRMIVASPESEIPCRRIFVGDRCPERHAQCQRIRRALQDAGRSDIEIIEEF